MMASVLLTLEQRVKEVVAECFQIDWRTIKNTDRFKENLGADSLDLTDLSFRLEREFETQKIDITKEAEENFETVQSVIDFLHNEGIEQ